MSVFELLDFFTSSKNYRQIKDLYPIAWSFLDEKNFDDFHRVVSEAAVLAAQFHDQVRWNEKDKKYQPSILSNRLTNNDFGSVGYYNHIHSLRILLQYIKEQMKIMLNSNENSRHTNIKDIMKQLSQCLNECIDNQVNEQYVVSMRKVAKACYDVFFAQDLEKVLQSGYFQDLDTPQRTGTSSMVFPGVITLLDVLGWKGIHQRQADAIPRLQEIIALLRKNAEEYGLGIDGILDTQVLSISDTIVISTQCFDDPISYRMGIELHGLLCADVLLKALEKGIPLRGAVCCGEYAMIDNIFVGPAVDEAASWHEFADWMGVHMSPSAACVYYNTSDAGCPASGVWTMWDIIFKNRFKRKVPCLKWTLGVGKEVVDTSVVREILRTRAPIFPEVSNKYDHTCDFLEYVKTHCPDDVASSHQEDGPESL